MLSTGSDRRRSSRLSSSLRDIMSHRPSVSSTTANSNESAKIQLHRKNYVPITSNNSLRPTITPKPTSHPTNPAKPRGLTDRSTTSSTTCTSSSSSDADSSHQSAGSSMGGSTNKNKERRELQDLVKVKDEEISYLKAQLASVEYENTKMAAENMALRLTAEQDKAVWEEKLRDATEQIRQHEAMADEFIKDVARLTSELMDAKAEAEQHRAKVEKMQGKLHKVVEDGSAFIQGLANQLNTTEEQLEKVRDEYNAIKLGTPEQAEKQQHRHTSTSAAEHATNSTTDDSKLRKDNSRRHHRHHLHQPWPRLTLDDGAEDEKKELLTSILDIAADHKFQDMVVKPPSPINSPTSSRSATDPHRRKTDAPPLKEIEIITSKLGPPIQEEQKKHHKRHRQIKVERAGRAA